MAKIDLRDWTDPMIGEVPNSNGYAVTWPSNRLMHVDTVAWVGDIPVDPEAADVNDPEVLAKIAAEFDDVDTDSVQAPQEAAQGADDAQGDQDTADDQDAPQGAQERPTIESLGLPPTAVDAILADDRIQDVDDLAGLAMIGELTTIQGVGQGNAAKIERALTDAGLIF